MKALALIEHVDRELDFIALIKALLARDHDVELEVANFYADAPLLLNGEPPRVVLTPFFYAVEDIILRDYVAAWPHARFINLAWEQLFYPSHAAIKAPRDEFSRTRVGHLAWSPEFVRYMCERGCRDVRLIGHGVYKLYDEPYRNFFISRDELAQRHGLDCNKRWVFVPENYRWAFFSDAKLRKLAKRGVARDDLAAARDYCRRSLAAMGSWCETLARRGEHEVIFRPRPATSVQEIENFFRDALGPQPRRFHVNKAESAREWVCASDVVASSHSTVLIEAALADKRVIKLEPEDTPDSLRYDWCDLLKQARTEADFIGACSETGGFDGAELRGWARALFFQAGDPVSALTRWIAEETRKAYAASSSPRKSAHAMRLSEADFAAARAMPPAERHAYFEARLPEYAFNRSTHEKDLFTQDDVEARCGRWIETLAVSASPNDLQVEAV